MKKAAILLATAATVAMLGLVALAPAGATVPDGTEGNPFGPGDKVTFCHYDGSDNGGGGSGKYNQPDASTTGTGPAGHIGHAFDVIPSYFFQQNANSPVTFYAGVNWPTLNNLPSSPIDFTPLLGQSGSSFIASGCAAPVTSTTTTTTVSPVPPTASLSTPVCTNQNIVATGVNSTPVPVTFDVFVNGVLVDSFIVAANGTGTSAAIPVKDNDVVTVKVQGSQTVLDTETVDLNCVTTTATTPPPPVTTATTPPPPVTTATTPPPPVTTTTTPPPPVGGGNPPPGPGGNNPPPHNNPPVQGPPLAFTGIEDVLPIGALALALLGSGTGLLWFNRKRDDE